jgi:hypothetical protein
VCIGNNKNIQFKINWDTILSNNRSIRIGGGKIRAVTINCVILFISKQFFKRAIPFHFFALTISKHSNIKIADKKCGLRERKRR